MNADNPIQEPEATASAFGSMVTTEMVNDGSNGDDSDLWYSLSPMTLRVPADSFSRRLLESFHQSRQDAIRGFVNSDLTAEGDVQPSSSHRGQIPAVLYSDRYR